mgnify:CR=1 FL=1
MITKRCLRLYAGGAQRNFHLHTNAMTTHYMGVRVDDANRYCPLASGVASNCINVRVAGANYHTVDYTPKLRFTYNVGYDSQPYRNPYYFSFLKIEMLNSVTINNPIELYLAGGDSWQAHTYNNVLTLTKDSVSAQRSDSYSTGYRFQTDDNYGGYIKIGNWTSSWIRISTSGGTVDITIPEAQWGV